MAKFECEFFPGTPAVWHCSHCNTHFGEKCIPDGHGGHWGRAGPRCIRCNRELNWLGSATGAKPFWQMLPHFFLYPLHTNSLIVIALITGLSLLLKMSLFSLLLGLFIFAVVIKYSFAIIEQRGSGDTTPPSLTAVITGDEHHLFLRWIVVLILMGVAMGVAGYLHPLLGLGVGIFLTLAMPASIVLLAVEKSVRRALDPGALMTLMFAIGWPYLLLWFCTQIIYAAPAYILPWLIQAVPMEAAVPVIAGITVYFNFILYAMLGYTLFEYQNELGFDTAVDGDSDMEEREFEKAKALGEATVLISDGDLTRARAGLRRALDLVRDDLALHLHYQKLLLLLDDDEALANHTNFLVGLLKNNKTLNQAPVIILEVQKRLPKFKLQDTETALEVGRLLQMQGQYKAVVRLFHNLHKTHARDPFLPQAYLLVATILFEQFGDDAKALAITQFILTQYPRCPERSRFEKLAELLHGSQVTPSAGPTVSG